MIKRNLLYGSYCMADAKGNAGSIASTYTLYRMNIASNLGKQCCKENSHVLPEGMLDRDMVGVDKARSVN